MTDKNWWDYSPKEIKNMTNTDKKFKPGGKINELVAKYPKTSFIIVSKIMWIFGFMFTLYAIDDHLPTVRQFTLASIYVLLTLPVSYWLTYSFSSKSKE